MASLAGATLTWRAPFLTAGGLLMHLHTDSLHRSGKQSGFHYSCSVEPWQSLARLGSSAALDRKSTRLNSSHVAISYAVFCLEKKNWAEGTGTKYLQVVRGSMGG